MEKSSVAIFLAIILGGSGLLFGYQAYSNTNISGVHRTKFTDDTFYDLVEHESTSEWSEFEEMEIRIYVENGESLYILFTTSICLKDDRPNNLGNVYYVIGIDGVRNISKYSHIYTHSDVYFEYIPVSLQSMISNLAEGFHTVHIYYSNLGHDTHSYYSAITVQTLK
ncbi:MAG: hypothetical protein GY870_22805 [archaeon]|nr:hypothetical protein [archaeon]